MPTNSNYREDRSTGSFYACQVPIPNGSETALWALARHMSNEICLRWLRGAD